MDLSGSQMAMDLNGYQKALSAAHTPLEPARIVYRKALAEVIWAVPGEERTGGLVTQTGTEGISR